MRRVHRCLLVLACSAVLWNAIVGGEDTKPAPATTPSAEMERLIKRLGSDEFDQREAATWALEAIGEPARDALWKAATENLDAEVQRRAKTLVEALNAKLYRELRSFKGHTDDVLSVALSPDGKRALSGSHDQTVRLWDVQTGKELRCFKGHTDDITCVVFSPDGKRALSGGSDHSMRLWDIETGMQLHNFTAHTDEVLSVAFSPDGKRALSGGRDQMIRLWQLSSDGKRLASQPTDVGGSKRE